MAAIQAIPLGLPRLPPNGERTLLLRRGDGERREERPLDGERWRRPRGDGERERRGLRPRADPVMGVVEAPDREHREPELLLSLGRLEEIMFERPQAGRYIMHRQRRHKRPPRPLAPLFLTPFSRLTTPRGTRMRAGCQGPEAFCVRPFKMAGKECASREEGAARSANRTRRGLKRMDGAHLAWAMRETLAICFL